MNWNWRASGSARGGSRACGGVLAEISLIFLFLGSACPTLRPPVRRYDNKASDLTKAGMKDGVSKTGCFLLFLSTGALARPFVQVTAASSCRPSGDLICPSALPHQFELRTAIELGKRIVLVHETEGAHGKFDFASEKAATPEDLRFVLDGAWNRPIHSHF